MPKRPRLQTEDKNDLTRLQLTPKGTDISLELKKSNLSKFILYRTVCYFAREFIKN